MATWDTNSYDWTKSAGSVFGNSAPSYSNSPWSGNAWSYGSSPSFTPDWGRNYDLPSLSGGGLLGGSGILKGIGRWNEDIPSYRSEPKFDVDRAFEAIGKSLSRLGQSQGIAGSNRSFDRTTTGTVGNAELVGKGRGYRMYQSSPTISDRTEFEQSGGSRGGGGLFGSIGSIAGPLLAATPFFGPLAVPIAAGVGRGIDAIAGT